MALTREWRARIERWRRVLATQFYEPLGDVELSGFTTLDHLAPEQAAGGSFEPMPPGTRWGGKYEYGWFKARVTIPEEAAGCIVRAEIEPGAEKLVFLDGRAVGMRHAALTESAEPGTTCDLLVEAYAGHGPTPVGEGPVPHGWQTVPEPPAAQRTVGRSTFGVWHEDAFQLWIDVETLWHLRESLDEKSLRVMQIEEGLRDFTLIVDLELPREEMMETIRAGRERLRPLLECRNGSTSPLMFAYGHAHLDVAWLWPLAETVRKAARTLSMQIELAGRYPEHKFLHSQPVLYQMVKDHYPALYERVKEAVAGGHVIADGSTWVEMDTNVTGGESLIRQFVHGKRFYREEFGVETELMWLPDVFGYCGAMPQIMRGCGVKYFSTAKIFWNYHGGDPFPHHTFIWEGIDGSGVLVHLCNDYNSQMRPSDVIGRWRELRDLRGVSTRLMPFGWGDGGGGPTREHLEYVRREADLEGCPRVQIAAPVEYFRDLEQRGVPDNRYVGELYYQCHRGTYTSQARTKRGNRKAELALREAEMWGVAAAVRAGFGFPADRMDAAWKKVLTQQFHDVLPGSSIRRVYEEAEAAQAEAVAAAREVAERAAAALTNEDTLAVTALNSLSWERTALVPLPEEFGGAAAGGRALPVQELEGRSFAEATVPACGWVSLRPGEPAEAQNALVAEQRLLENEHLRLEFNERAELSSVYDKDAARELAAGPCNSFRMYKDVPSWFDAWDIDSMYEDQPVELPESAEFTVVAAGPLVAVLRIRRRLHESEVVQDVLLRRGSRRVDFETTIDWHERHKLLKVAFPVGIHASEAIHEIQFGHVRRPNHRSRPFDADRFEVANQKWTALAEEGRGCAVLNDCKYGVNVLGNTIKLTLLKSPIAPDMHAELGTQQFTYAFYAWNGSFGECGLVREGYELNCPVTTAPGDAGERSLFSLDAPNVVIETVKPAEDGSGDVIVRLYESKRTATRCTLATTLPLYAASRANMLEEPQEDLEVTDGHVALELRPFQIVTLRLKA